MAAVAADNRASQRKGSDIGMKKDVRCSKRIFLFYLLSTSIAASVIRGETQRRIDYVAKLNEISRKDRHESLNAARFYQEAAILYVERPDGLSRADIESWPSELTETKKSLLRRWALDNSIAFRELKRGTQKPYYWNEYNGHTVWHVKPPPGLTELREIVQARLLHIKLAAAKVGVTKQTREDVLACCRCGHHLAQSRNGTAQLLGLLMVDKTTQTLLQCLSKTDPDRKALDMLQSGLQEQFLKNHNYADDLLEAEKLRHLEYVQFLFPSGEDDAKLRSEDEMEMSTYPGIAFEDIEDLRRGKTLRNIEIAFAYCKEILGMSPWQARNKNLKFREDLNARTGRNPLVTRYMLNIPKHVRIRAHCRAGRDGLLTVLAVLRFKHEKSHLPKNLQELLSSGHLSQLPMDPYSNDPLVYTSTGNNFLLYSLSDDFEDDRGVAGNWAWGEREGDHVFWPVQPLK